jgi:hypothetical protein
MARFANAGAGERAHASGSATGLEWAVRRDVADQGCCRRPIDAQTLDVPPADARPFAARPATINARAVTCVPRCAVPRRSPPRSGLERRPGRHDARADGDQCGSLCRCRVQRVALLLTSAARTVARSVSKLPIIAARQLAPPQMPVRTRAKVKPPAVPRFTPLFPTRAARRGVAVQLLGITQPQGVATGSNVNVRWLRGWAGSHGHAHLQAPREHAASTNQSQHALAHPHQRLENRPARALPRLQLRAHTNRTPRGAYRGQLRQRPARTQQPAAHERPRPDVC